jgi:hypothetical protein
MAAIPSTPRQGINVHALTHPTAALQDDENAKLPKVW